MLCNKEIAAQYINYDEAKHPAAHIFRAVQEGVAFAFRYGLDMIRENNIQPSVIRAARSNLFLSDVFAGSFVNSCAVPLELFKCDGSVGAAIGAGIGAGYYKTPGEAFFNLKPLQVIEPKNISQYEELYQHWKQLLEDQLRLV
jgi:xylulokinase